MAVLYPEFGGWMYLTISHYQKMLTDVQNASQEIIYATRPRADAPGPAPMPVSIQDANTEQKPRRVRISNARRGTAEDDALFTQLPRKEMKLVKSWDDR